MRTLVVPPAAQRDEDAIQMLSAWIAERALHCTVNIGMWHSQGHNEPTAWGILLADVIRHIANALKEDSGFNTEATVKTIINSLLTELNEPTSEASGEFHPGNN